MKRILSLFIFTFIMLSLGAVATAEEQQPSTIKSQFDDVMEFQEGVAFVKVGEKWGLINNNGEVIVHPQYDDARSFVDGMAAVAKEEKWGFIDKKGNLVIDYLYDSQPGDFVEGLAAVYVYDKGWGFIDKTGKEVIQPQYGETSSFENGVAVVGKESGMVELIDKMGNPIVQTQYYYSYDLLPWDKVWSEGLLWLHTGEDIWGDDQNRLGAINQKGEVIIDFIYGTPTYQLDGGEYGNRLYEFSDGVAIVGSDFKRVIIDTEGNVVGSLQQFDGDESLSITSFKEGLASFRIGADWDSWKWGFVDKTGKVVIKNQYDEVKDFSEGLAAFRIGDYETGKWGFVDRTGKQVVKAQYENAYSFSEGLAWVQKGGKWGAIDKTGKEIIKPLYDGWFVEADIAYKFTEGLAYVRIGEKFGYIDKTGKEVIKPIFDNAWYLNEGLAPVNAKGKWGYMVNPLTAYEPTIDQYHDYSTEEYWAEHMIWSMEKGLVKGYVNQLHPSTKEFGNWINPYGTLTESQFLTILFRYMDPVEYSNTVPATDFWATIPYQMAMKYNLPTKGSLTNHAPATQGITRGTMAKIFVSLHLNKQVSEKEAIQWMYNNGISTGYADATGTYPKTYESFRPNNELKRAQIVSFVKRFDEVVK